MIRSYYRCCCINQPVIFSHCVHFKLGHRFHALLKVCSDRDDIAPLTLLEQLLTKLLHLSKEVNWLVMTAGELCP